MDWLAVRDIVKQLDISDPTLRRYIRDHGDFIKTKKEANMLMISHDSIEVIEQIREWYLSGLRHQQVDAKLREHFSLSVVIANDSEKGEITVLQTIESMQKLQQVVARMVEENHKLHNEIADLKRMMEERDNQNQETVEEIVSLLKKGEKKGLFSRWFGK